MEKDVEDLPPTKFSQKTGESLSVRSSTAFSREVSRIQLMRVTSFSGSLERLFFGVGGAWSWRALS